MYRFSSLFEHFFPVKIDIFFIFVMGSWQTALNFTFCWFWLRNKSKLLEWHVYRVWGMPNPTGWFWEILSSSIWLKHLCVFLRNKYGFQIGNAIKKYKLCFNQGRNAPNSLILHAYKFLDMLIPMAQVLRLYIQGYMYALSWYLLIIRLFW